MITLPSIKIRYVIVGLILYTIASLYINRNVYYIGKWNMYFIIENNNDTTTVYFSNSRWNYGDDYVRYRPQCAEISDLNVYNAGDSFYAVERYMDITEVSSKSFKIKPVYLICGDKLKGEFEYWTDSTYLNKDCEWISINHRHGLYKSWK